MLFAYTTIFSLIEWLAITGFCQGVLILVYVLLRIHNWRQASLTVSFFLMLTLAFGLQFALRMEDYGVHIRLALWFVWAMTPPLCYLLVLQIIKLVDLPDKREFWVLALVPAAAGFVFAFGGAGNLCEKGGLFCNQFFHFLYLMGGIAGALSLLLLWMHKGLLTKLSGVRNGDEKFWLIISLLAMNVGAIAVNILRATESVSESDADAMLVTMGIAFIYIVSTVLFRVYPSPVQLSSRSRLQYLELSEEEKIIAQQVKKLMELDKVYQEPGFSRADLAKELNTSESTLSKVINVTFGKSFPKLINDLRIEDAKRLLANPDIPVQTVASESGFNSIASFNRVFRDMTGATPSTFREGQKGRMVPVDAGTGEKKDGGAS